MTLILFVALVIIGGLLAETRQRLSRLEGEMEERRRRGLPEEPTSVPARAAARVIVREELVVEAAPPGDIPAEPEPILVQPLETPPAEPEIHAAETAERVGTPWAKAEPEHESEPVHPRTSGGFEDLFGRKLPIWAGGVTLLVAAVLLVKYSIDMGLLSPWVRVTLGVLFGGALIAGAELARRMERFVQDDRIAQALAGAGIGSLYAATLAAHSLYHLIPPAAAFAGLSAITVLAMGLALRFGTPCAVLALVGGLATPAVVQSGEPNIPVLSGYLAMVIGSLTVLSRRQRWFWLGVMALAGGMGWTALIIVMGALGEFSVLSVGLLVLLLGIALPMLTSEDERSTLMRAVAAAAAALQLAVLVSQGGYDVLSWGLYGLLSLAFLWLTSRMPILRPMMVVPLGISLVLAYLWPQPPVGLFGAVLGGTMLIFGGSALWRLWRTGGSTVEAGQIIALATGGYFVVLHQFGAPIGMQSTSLALLGVAFAVLPALGLALGWRAADRQQDLRFPFLALASGFLLVWAGFIGFHDWFQPIAMASVSAALLLVGRLSQDRRISDGAFAYLIGGLIMLVGTAFLNGEIEHPEYANTVHAVLRWGVTALVWAGFAWRYTRSPAGIAVTAVTAALAYGLAAQLIPAVWLPIATALGIAGLALVARRRLATELTPALLTLGGIVLLWMFSPFADWLGRGVASFASMPVLVTQLPAPDVVLRRLLVPALLCGLSFWLVREKVDPRLRLAVPAVIALPMLAGVHCLYKLVFAIDGAARFVSLGVAERTLWEVLLIGSGLAAWRWARQREAALVLVGAGFAHNLLYSMLLHDPLWSQQAVGPLPFLNLLLPTFAIAFLSPRGLAWIEPRIEQRIARGTPLWHMAIMLLFAYASLRQLFCGGVFALAHVGQVESIFWSVLAIALAIGWLLWGIRTASRDWRIGSLVLMLAAIAKVFLIDASGLEGLLRVASFLALGFSLIGIGWLYSRYLRADPV